MKQYRPRAVSVLSEGEAVAGVSTAAESMSVEAPSVQSEVNVLTSAFKSDVWRKNYFYVPSLIEV